MFLTVFLPTPSVRRATGRDQRSNKTDEISTHALREEGDILVGELAKLLRQFLPTPSVRRATSDHQRQHLGRLYFYPRPP